MGTIEIPFRNEWSLLIVDDQLVIRDCNQFASCYIGSGHEGSKVTAVIPWLRPDWFTKELSPRLVKTSLNEKILLEIAMDIERPGWFLICFRKVSDYADSEHLWCEVADSIIGVQRFIDTSYDGIVVADGQSKVLAVNEAFVHISGIPSNQVIGRNFKELLEEQLVPQSCTLQSIEQKATVSAVVKYPQGKEAIVSSTPLFDKSRNIVRVLSNVRDITELNSLHEKLKCVKALATGFQRELKAIQAANLNVNVSLVRSRIMENLYELITKVASTDLQLLITGDSGVGKTALAKFVHMMSERNTTGNFIHVNCSAIPETLLESELFGYEEGSFTGAKKSKVGLFELANKGTLFLDEIGDMPLPLQAKILNVLQEGKFYRVGGTKEVNVDVRIIAATNTNLNHLIANGRFRQDLYYRLNVIPIRVPSLAERKEDIPPLLAHYLEVSNNRYKKNKTFSPEAMEHLLKYNWPGNIRELINLLERLVVIVDEATIEFRHLPSDIAGHTNEINESNVIKMNSAANKFSELQWNPTACLKDTVEIIERRIIEDTIAQKGSLKEAAKLLGVDVTTLIRKRKRTNSK